MTRSGSSCPISPMSASVTPSAKYSSFGAPDTSASGRTASERIDVSAGAAHGRHHMRIAIATAAAAAATPNIQRPRREAEIGVRGIVPESIVSSAVMTWPASAYRAAGAFSRHRRMTGARSARSGRRSGTGWCRIPAVNSNDVAPSNGRRPVAISYNTTPSAHTSLRVVASSPRRISGAM